MSLLWMEYETEFEHLVENGDELIINDIVKRRLSIW